MRHYLKLLKGILCLAFGTFATSVLGISAGVGASVATASSALSSMLSVIPDSPENRNGVTLVDLGAAAKSFEGKPPQTGDLAGAQVYVKKLNDAIPGLLEPVFGRRPFLIDEWRAELGFSVVDVARTARANFGPGEIRVFDLLVDAKAIDRAVRSDPVWSELLKKPTYRAQRYYQWSTGSEMDLTKYTAVRPLGAGGQLSVSSGRAVFTTDDTQAKLSIDAKLRKKPSLAAWKDGSVAVETVVRSGAYGIQLIAPGQFGPESVDFSPPKEFLKLGRYEAVAIGVGGASAKRFSVISYVHANPANAAANKGRLKAILDGDSKNTDTPWAEILKVESITVEGKVLTVRFSGPRPGNALKSAFARDNLFIWE
jgi:hypothetical protein